MTDPFSNEALQQTLNTQADIYRNIRNKALDEAIRAVVSVSIPYENTCQEACDAIRSLKVEE